MDCQYCGKNFSTRGSLTRHQKTIKYCMDLQSMARSPTFKCEGCDKYLSTKYNLSAHQKICQKLKIESEESNKDIELKHLREKLDEKDITVGKLENHVKELENHVKELENKLFEIALKSKGKTTITTNIQQNFTPITDEKLAEDSKKLTIQHLAGGGEKMADIFLDGSLKKNAICTDFSRKILHLKDGDGKIIKDVNAGTITKRAFTSMLKIARDIKNKYGEGIDTNDDDQIEMFGKVMSVVGEMAQAISGQSNEVSTDFAKAVCIGSIA
jgi:hypothetical protein